MSKRNYEFEIVPTSDDSSYQVRNLYWDDTLIAVEYEDTGNRRYATACVEYEEDYHVILTEILGEDTDIDVEDMKAMLESLNLSIEALEESYNS